MNTAHHLLTFFGIISVFAQNSKRPNFIFLLTDDLDYVFDTVSYMPNTLKYIANAGLTFNNAFVSTPVCCPSRVETITGRNYQNIGAPNGTCMSVDSETNVINNTKSWFQKFHDNGYTTGSFGKLTNDMQNFWCINNPLTNGFDRINGPCVRDYWQLKYFDLYMNGTQNLTVYPLAPSMYEISFMSNNSINWLHEIMNNNDTKDKPFMAWIGSHAPHFPADPAPWYQNTFNDKKAPRTPHFNLKVYDHHDFVSTNPILNDTAINWIDQLYRDRLRSLLTLDDLVDTLFNLLKQYNILDNTYVLFTSDHGYHLGQWRVACEKRLPYETDIRIPLFLFGPNITSNTVTNNLVGNIDILPTLLDLAGIGYDKNDYDGRSWIEFINNPNNSDSETVWNRDIYLSQFGSNSLEDFSACSTWWPDKNNSFHGQELNPPGYNEYHQSWMNNAVINNWRSLRILNETSNCVYSEYYVNKEVWNDNSYQPSFYEFFDIEIDPYQIDNIYNTLSDPIKVELHQNMMKYGQCKGVDCW